MWPDWLCGLCQLARRLACDRAGNTLMMFALTTPLVFGLAPLVNVLYSMATHPPRTAPNPLLYVGFVLAAVGAGMVLYFKPQS